MHSAAMGRNGGIGAAREKLKLVRPARGGERKPLDPLLGSARKEKKKDQRERCVLSRHQKLKKKERM